MITSTNLKTLRNLEAFQVYSDLAAFLKQEEKGKEFEEPLKGVCDTFYARLQDYDTALSPERRNPRTAELARLDAQRDYILRSFIANLKLYVASPDAEQAQTADILLALVDKYGRNIPPCPTGRKPPPSPICCRTWTSRNMRICSKNCLRSIG